MFKHYLYFGKSHALDFFFTKTVVASINRINQPTLYTIVLYPTTGTRHFHDKSLKGEVAFSELHSPSQVWSSTPLNPAGPYLPD